MQVGVGLLILHVMPRQWSLHGYRHGYLKFYQLPNSNCFPTVCYFSREKPLVKPTAPGSPSHIICLCDLFCFALFSDLLYQKPQNILFQFILFGVRSINIYNSLSSVHHFWRRYPKGIDNPFNTSVCEYLVFACRCRLRIIAWFS